MTPRTTTRRPLLDGLRGVAVLAVMVRHWGVPGIPKDWLRLGDLGVTLFFVISGFLITRTTVKLIEKYDSVVRVVSAFWVSRVFRIFPPYYALIGVLLVVRAIDWSDAGWLASYLTNYWFILSEEWHGPLAAMWSLAIEEQFYLFWPFVLLLVRANGWRVAIAAGAGVVGVAWRLYFTRADHLWTAWLALPACLDALAVGCALAFVEPFLTDRSVARVQWMSGALALALVAQWRLGGTYVAETPTGLTVFSILFGCAVYRAFHEAASTAWMNRLLALRPLRFVGTISYGLYLFHLPVSDILVVRLLRDAAPSYVQVWVANFAATFAVATLSWYTLERGAQAWKAWVLRQPFFSSGVGHRT